jgi:hypothetical protein
MAEVLLLPDFSFESGVLEYLSLPGDAAYLKGVEVLFSLSSTEELPIPFKLSLTA